MVQLGHRSRKITPPIAAAGLLGPDLVQYLVPPFTPPSLWLSFSSAWRKKRQIQWLLPPSFPLHGVELLDPLWPRHLALFTRAFQIMHTYPDSGVHVLLLMLIQHIKCAARVATIADPI